MLVHPKFELRWCILAAVQQGNVQSSQLDMLLDAPGYSVAAQVRELVQLGLLRYGQAEGDSCDARQDLVSLTEQGASLLRTGRGSVQEHGSESGEWGQFLALISWNILDMHEYVDELLAAPWKLRPTHDASARPLDTDLRLWRQSTAACCNRLDLLLDLYLARAESLTKQRLQEDLAQIEFGRQQLANRRAADQLTEGEPHTAPQDETEFNPIQKAAHRVHDSLEELKNLLQSYLEAATNGHPDRQAFAEKLLNWKQSMSERADTMLELVPRFQTQTKQESSDDLSVWLRHRRRRQTIHSHLVSARTPLTVTDIARTTGISYPTVATTLRELQDRDLILCINPSVGRGKQFQATDRGERIVNEP